jgi:hypothetical protein
MEAYDFQGALGTERGREGRSDVYVSSRLLGPGRHGRRGAVFRRETLASLGDSVPALCATEAVTIRTAALPLSHLLEIAASVN